MSRNDFSDLPNPFSTAQLDPRRSAHGFTLKKLASITPLVASAKYLLVVALCFSALLAARHFSGQWLLSRLTADFENLPRDQQQSRLAQLAGLGQPAISYLVDTLVADDIQTARTAYDLLRHSQNEWMQLSDNQRYQHHQTMVESIQEIADRLPDDRTGWAASLIQQSILETVAQEDTDAAELYRLASATLGHLTLADRSGPSILSKQAITLNDSASQDELSTRPTRLNVSSDLLPVDGTSESGRWTQWPPLDPPTTSPKLSDPGLHADHAPPRQPSPRQQSTLQQSPHATASLVPPPGPTVYKSASSVRLRPVMSDDQVSLRSFDQAQQTAAGQATETLVQSPMEAFSESSVIRWLASDQSSLREQARLQLISRGYSEHDLAIATRIASPDATVRMQLVDLISRDGDTDPRRWLWMMAEDENREVRLRVVSVLGTLTDTGAHDKLRSLLTSETDPIVTARIERILGFR